MNNEIVLHFNEYEEGEGFVPAWVTLKDKNDLRSFLDEALERMETVLYGSCVDYGDGMEHPLTLGIEPVQGANDLPIIDPFITLSVSVIEHGKGFMDHKVAFNSPKQLNGFLSQHLSHIPMCVHGSYVDYGDGIERSLKIIVM